MVNIKRITYFIGIIMLIYITKPQIIFKPNGQLREYGFGYTLDGYRKTLFSIHTIIIFIILLLFIYIKY
jgi:hypothetical protein